MNYSPELDADMVYSKLIQNLVEVQILVHFTDCRKKGVCDISNQRCERKFNFEMFQRLQIAVKSGHPGVNYVILQEVLCSFQICAYFEYWIPEISQIWEIFRIYTFFFSFAN